MLQETAEVEWQVQRVDALAVELVVLTLGPLDEEPKQFISFLVLVQILELLEVECSLAFGVAQLKEDPDLLLSQLYSVGREHVVQLLHVNLA